MGDEQTQGTQINRKHSRSSGIQNKSKHLKRKGGIKGKLRSSLLASLTLCHMLNQHTVLPGSTQITSQNEKIYIYIQNLKVLDPETTALPIWYSSYNIFRVFQPLLNHFLCGIHDMPMSL